MEISRNKQNDNQHEPGRPHGRNGRFATGILRHSTTREGDAHQVAVQGAAHHVGRAVRDQLLFEKEGKTEKMSGWFIK